jgi:hypothetical protein
MQLRLGTGTLSVIVDAQWVRFHSPQSFQSTRDVDMCASLGGTGYQFRAKGVNVQLVRILY